MAEISQKDQLALHEFSVRYRAGFAQANPTTEQNLDTVRDALREQYTKEQETQRGVTMDSPAPEPDQDKEPEQPEP